jgi:hypothetical protein
MAFSQLPAEAADLAPDSSRLMIADLDLSGSVPKLINQKSVYQSKDHNCVLEPRISMITIPR